VPEERLISGAHHPDGGSHVGVSFHFGWNRPF